MSRAPIFIGGMQRSGTSLMRSIIGSHPDVAIFQWDLPIWTNIYPAFTHFPHCGNELCDAVLDAFFATDKVKNCDIQLDRDRIKSRVLSLRKTGFAEIADAFLREYADRVGRPRWGLKTPHNEFYAQQIFASYADARMVQLVRDPRDCSLSFQNYDDNWANDYDALAHAEMWQQSVQLGLKNQAEFAGRYLVVKYEELVRDPEQTISRVCKTLNLDFLPEMLLMNGHLGWRGSNSSFQRRTSKEHKISTDSIGRYRRQSNDFDIRLYEAILKDELTSCGYVIDNGRRMLPLKIQFAIKAEKALRGTMLERKASKLRRRFVHRGRRAQCRAA